MRRQLARWLPLGIIAVALVLYLPWLSEVEWQGSAVSTLSQVEEGRPSFVDGRTLYVVLAMAAETLVPGSTALAVHLLSLAGAVVAALAVAGLRRRLNPASSIIEPLAAAATLIVAGLFWRQSVAADIQTVEVAMTVVAAMLAWGGRPVAGMACFQLALLTSARSILNLPIMLLAIRQRQDWKPALAWLVPWVLFALVIRPQITPAAVEGATAGYAGSLAVDGLISLLGLSGAVVLAGIGAIGICTRAIPDRRFLVAVLLALVLHVVVQGRVASWGLAYVPLYPWVAVLAAGTIGTLRRLGEQRFGMGRWLTVAFVIAVLVLSGLVSERYLVAPHWQRARNFSALCGELRTAFRIGRVAGSWSDLRLFELANREWLRAGSVRSQIDLPRHRPADARARTEVDRLLAEGDLLILFDQRMAVRLTGGQTAAEQLLVASQHVPEHLPQTGEGAVVAEPQWFDGPGAAGARARGRLGEFDGGLTLLEVGLIPPRPRAGGLLSLRLLWQQTEPAEVVPKVAVAIVDGAGAVRYEVSYWLGFGLVDMAAIGADQALWEHLIVYLPEALEPGEYGVEVAVYRPLRGDSTLRDMALGHGRQERRAIRVGTTPRGVTPVSLRAATMRLGPARARQAQPPSTAP